MGWCKMFYVTQACHGYVKVVGWWGCSFKGANVCFGYVEVVVWVCVAYLYGRCCIHFYKYTAKSNGYYLGPWSWKTPASHLLLVVLLGLNMHTIYINKGENTQITCCFHRDSELCVWHFTPLQWPHRSRNCASMLDVVCQDCIHTTHLNTYFSTVKKK